MAKELNERMLFEREMASTEALQPEKLRFLPPRNHTGDICPEKSTYFGFVTRKRASLLFLRPSIHYIHKKIVQAQPAKSRTHSERNPIENVEDVDNMHIIFPMDD